MKNLSKPIVLIAIVVIAMTSSRKLKAQPQNFVNFQIFYNELNPYGSWIDYPEYGYVWSPNAGANFRPYSTNGYWVATEYGNTWVSDYSWGWAPFHYGRWMFDNYYGWLWVPGNEWAPAWVAWRSGGGYYGWAPLSPNINISVSFNHIIPSNYWVFVPQRHICGPGLSNYYVQHNHVVNIINNTTIINNVHHSRRYYTGPSVHEMESVRGRPVHMYAINNSNRPGRTVVYNRSINIYRPQVEHGNRDFDRPEHFTRRDDRNGRGIEGNYSRDRFDNDHNNRQHSEVERNSDRHDQRQERYDRNGRQVQSRRSTDESVQRQHEVRSHAKSSDNIQGNNDQLQNHRHEHSQNFERQNQDNYSRQSHEHEGSRQQDSRQNNMNTNRSQQNDQPRISDTHGHSRSAHEIKRGR
jgi:hypothetical protein